MSKIIVSDYEQLERAASKVASSTKVPIICSGDIAKDVRSFFSTYERSDELGWFATIGGIAAIGAAIVLSGGLVAVGGAAVAAVAAGVKGDIDRKATQRLSLGHICYELAKSGYRMTNGPGTSITLTNSDGFLSWLLR